MLSRLSDPTLAYQPSKFLSVEAHYRLQQNCPKLKLLDSIKLTAWGVDKNWIIARVSRLSIWRMRVGANLSHESEATLTSTECAIPPNDPNGDVAMPFDEGQIIAIDIFDASLAKHHALLHSRLYTLSSDDVDVKEKFADNLLASSFFMSYAPRLVILFDPFLVQLDRCHLPLQAQHVFRHKLGVFCC